MNQRCRLLAPFNNAGGGADDHIYLIGGDDIGALISTRKERARSRDVTSESLLGQRIKALGPPVDAGCLGPRY